MTREQILRNQLDMASHNLSCYSANLLMDTPKPGYEEQHKEAAAEVEMLKIWLKEFHRSNTDSTREFIGTISEMKSGKTYDGKPLIDHLGFLVDIGKSWLDGDRRIFNVGPEVQEWLVSGQYDIDRHERYDEGKSDTVRITVDTIEYIRAIEWAE